MFIAFREMPEDEAPPRSIWFSQRQLEDHFEAVKRRREEEMGGKKDGPGPIKDPVDNAASRGLIVGSDS